MRTEHLSYLEQIGEPAFLGDLPRTVGAIDDHHQSTVVTLYHGAVAGQRQTRRKPAVHPLSLWRLKRVQAFVDAHIDQPLRLADLAAVAGLSRMYFAAQFRAAMGVTPHHYVVERRIAHAKSAMAQSSASLVDIALDAGFQSQAHFCTTFKLLTGVTPSLWRRQAKFAEALMIDDRVARSMPPAHTGGGPIGVEPWRSARPAASAHQSPPFHGARHS